MEPQTAKERQTERFINENPVDIALVRGVRQPDGAGGWIISDPEPMDPQTVRVVQQRTSATVERRTIEGEAVRPAITLVCMPATDVVRGDTFTWQGLPAEVVWITDLGYVKHAEVAI